MAVAGVSRQVFASMDVVTVGKMCDQMKPSPCARVVARLDPSAAAKVVDAMQTEPCAQVFDHIESQSGAAVLEQVRPPPPAWINPLTSELYLRDRQSALGTCVLAASAGNWFNEALSPHPPDTGAMLHHHRTPKQADPRLKCTSWISER